MSQITSDVSSDTQEPGMWSVKAFEGVNSAQSVFSSHVEEMQTQTGSVNSKAGFLSAEAQRRSGWRLGVDFESLPVDLMLH